MRRLIATAADRQAMRRYTVTAAGYPSQSTVTGLPVAEDEHTITVRLYSAGCLHQPYVIRRGDVLTDSPHFPEAQPAAAP